MVRSFATIAASIYVLDRITKSIIEAYRPDVSVLPGILDVRYATNTGISFGLLRAYPWIPLLFSFAVIVAILYKFQDIPKDWLAQTSTALIFAGALGNLTDRLFYGAVIDFIDLSFWPSFNVADSAVVIGAILAMIYLYREEESGKKKR